MPRAFALVAAAVLTYLMTAVVPVCALAAQGTTAAVKGTVKDESGAPVAGASILIQGAVTRKTASDSTGAFSLSELPPDLYTVTVTKAGYNTAVQNGVAFFSGETTTRMVAASVPAKNALPVVPSRP